MRDGGQHAEMHNTPVIYRLQQRDTNVVVVTAASVGEASLQRLLGTISAVRAADGDSWWRGFWPGGDCSQRDEWTLRGGEETGELRRPSVLSLASAPSSLCAVTGGTVGTTPKGR